MSEICVKDRNPWLRAKVSSSVSKWFGYSLCCVTQQVPQALGLGQSGKLASFRRSLFQQRWTVASFSEITGSLSILHNSANEG